MRKKSVVVLDSGLGGLHILAECIKTLPNYEYLYIADTFNAPYGEKSKKKLIKIAIELVNNIIKKHNPEIIVFACNTLTVNAIKEVREKFFKTKIVGVEPALKTAKTYGGDTIIFATKSTLKHYKKLDKKIERSLKLEYKKQNLKYYNTDKTYKIHIKNLPALIEENSENLDNLLPLLNQTFCYDKYQKCLNMVLGCTHFIGIKEQLNTLFPNIKFFDGAKAVAKRVAEIALHPAPQNYSAENEPQITILTTNGDRIKQKSFEKYFKTLID